MTALLEKVISIIAPHHCMGCGIENNILCDMCAHDVFMHIPPLCVFCERPTIDWQICNKCSKGHALSSVWVVSEYSGLAADLLCQFKFERAKAAYVPLAKVLDTLLPHIGTDAVVVPLPTANNRVRQRGYDQSVLLAKELARLRKLQSVPVLERQGSTRQTGADRKQRIKHAQTAYRLTDAGLVKDKVVWLIDDICTTGASLSAAADLVKAAGASQVHAAVVAWQKRTDHNN